MIAAAETAEISYLYRLGVGRVTLVRVQHGEPDTVIVGYACNLDHALKARAWLT